MKLPERAGVGLYLACVCVLGMSAMWSSLLATVSIALLYGPLPALVIGLGSLVGIGVLMYLAGSE